MMFALYQLRWELLTDPAQKTRKLGRFFTSAINSGSPRWTDGNSDGEDITLYDECGGSGFIPGLSQVTHFRGDARMLVEVSRERHVKVRVLNSSLPVEVTERLKQALAQSLEVHPVVTFPAKGAKFDRMSLIFGFSFHHPEWIGKPKVIKQR